jgi:hypothetical protein
MSYDAKRDDPHAALTFIVGAVGTILLIVVVVLLEIFYYRARSQEEYRKVTLQAPEELTRLRAQQEAELAGYAWVDEANAVLRIPIDRAMELVVLEQDARRGAGAR